jgi:hypothetical protein
VQVYSTGEETNIFLHALVEQSRPFQSTIPRKFCVERMNIFSNNKYGSVDSFNYPGSTLLSQLTYYRLLQDCLFTSNVFKTGKNMHITTSESKRANGLTKPHRNSLGNMKMGRRYGYLTRCMGVDTARYIDIYCIALQLQ